MGTVLKTSVIINKLIFNIIISRVSKEIYVLNTNNKFDLLFSQIE